jgi:3-deoxy-D-manno-octulosonate 8-phosphate phosphatase (KDO 8-P phosphatase)
MSNRIKYLVMDVDGTLTDGKIYMGVHGELMKAFDIKDGYGIHDMLIPAGVTPVIITGRKSEILENRCGELGIKELFQGVKDKVSKLNAFLSDYKADLSQVAYIGDDLNDLECMKAVKDAGGMTGCPRDAVNGVIRLSNFRSKKNGGNGAVREFIEYVLKINKKKV